HYQMRDLPQFEVETKVRDRLARERKRLVIVTCHSLRRVGEHAAAVKAVAIELERIGTRCETRVTVFDLRTFGHAPEQLSFVIVLEKERHKIYELLMKVICRDSAPNLVDEDWFGHAARRSSFAEDAERKPIA